MSDEFSRLRQLAGLSEADEHVMSQDEQNAYDDQQDEARYAREDHIKKLIILAFKRCQLPIAHDGVAPAILYSEDDREATVQLDESEIDLDRLLQLKRSGLSDRYVVQVGADSALDIVFIVAPTLDRAR